MKHRLKFSKTNDPPGDAAELISRGNIVGWFQGRMDWSSHSLGSRSVLSSSFDTKSKDRLNHHLKQRSKFMPFAVSILQEDAHKYIKGSPNSPHMMMAYDVLPHAKDDIIATVHVDGTTRPQTVTKEDFPLFYDLIRECDKMTAVPAVLERNMVFRL